MKKRDKNDSGLTQKLMLMMGKSMHSSKVGKYYRSLKYSVNSAVKNVKNNNDSLL